MSGLAAILSWEGPTDDTHRGVARMLAAAPHRGPDGAAVRQVSLGVFFGFSRFITSASLRREAQPIATPGEHFWIIADARIDNRDELFDLLTEIPWLSPDSTDPLLILAGYERWGEAVAERLVGDFAFIIWDEGKRLLFAARDPITMRPLFYHHREHRFLALASEPVQFFGLPGVSKEPDEQMLSEFLVDLYHRDSHRSEFRDIRRLPGGHALVAQRGKITVRRFWDPQPAPEPRWSSEADCLDEFVQVANQAVERRLDAEGPILALVSGGYDSAAILGMAHHLGQKGVRPDGGLHLAYMTFGATHFDESPCIRAALGQLPYPTHAVEAKWPRLDEAVQFSAKLHKYRSANPLQMTLPMTPTVHSVGSRVVLRGDGGDQLFTEGDVWSDLLARGLNFQSLKEAWWHNHFGSPGPLTVRCRSVLRALRRIVPSYLAPVARLAKSGKAKNGRVPHEYLPDYLTPRARELVGGGVDSWYSSLQPPDYPSRVQRDLWTMVVHMVNIDRYMETLALEAMYNGFEYRTPLYDLNLIRFMLSVPFEWRIPNGMFKAFLVKGARRFLPHEIVERNRKIARYDFNAMTLKRWRSDLVALLFDRSEWHSAAYIEQESARTYIERVNLDDPVGDRDYGRARQIDRIWHIAGIELWLRNLNAQGTAVGPCLT